MEITTKIADDANKLNSLLSDYEKTGVEFANIIQYLRIHWQGNRADEFFKMVSSESQLVNDMKKLNDSISEVQSFLSDLPNVYSSFDSHFYNKNIDV